MITQNVKASIDVSSMVVDLGNGDVAISIGELDGKVALTLSNMHEAENVGDPVHGSNLNDTPIVILFENTDGAIVLKKMVQEAVKQLRKRDEQEKYNKYPRFTVPFKNVFVTTAFKGSNPASDKIMTCYSKYVKDGTFDRDIEVTKNIVLKDGYVAYIVAGFVGKTDIDVVAPEGIEMKLDQYVINFKSSEIEISYDLLKDENNPLGKAFYLTIYQDGEKYRIAAEDNIEAVKYLSKINNTFNATFKMHSTSTLNVGLMERAKEAGLNVTIE